MKRNIDMSEVSDGKLYTSRDMVRLGCEDCKGCSACCHGMGDSIVLDPYDICQLTKELGCTFEQLLAGKMLRLLTTKALTLRLFVLVIQCGTLPLLKVTRLKPKCSLAGLLTTGQ